MLPFPNWFDYVSSYMRTYSIDLHPEQCFQFSYNKMHVHAFYHQAFHVLIQSSMIHQAFCELTESSMIHHPNSAFGIPDRWHLIMISHLHSTGGLWYHKEVIIPALLIVVGTETTAICLIYESQFVWLVWAYTIYAYVIYYRFMHIYTL